MKNRFLVMCALAVGLTLSLSAQQNPPPDTSSSGQSTQQSTQPSTQPATSTDRYGNPVPATDNSQSQNPNNQDAQSNEQTPVYRVTVIQRTTEAVNYRDRSGSTEVDFKGTPLMPRADGHAKVTGHTGRFAVDATLHHIGPARGFGPEYLTYVLWAITTEGRAVNLGEVIPNGDGDVSLQVTSGLPEFGMIVTAEPYFAVTRPSDLVVAENIVRPDTAGGIHPISARYELLQKGQYTVNLSPAQLPATAADKKTPLQMLEAQNAIAIAEASGAEQYAAGPLQKARDYLAQAQDYQRRKQSSKVIATVARASAENAEDARLMTLEKKRQEQIARERQAAQDRIQNAQSRALAESARAEEARRDAQREAEQRSIAEQERQSAERARLQAEQAAQEAAAEKVQAQQAMQQAEAARQAAVQQQQALSQQADQARLQAQQTEEMRQRLLQQLNQVLQTRDSARGLIVNMSDVLFDTAKATLKPGARLRLAKVSGIILAYPDLKLEIDGFTDSVGGDEYNQELSERRAQSVRDFLVSQGVPANNTTTHGYGKENPVASNSTASGRQMNRRVELVVSGNAIGDLRNGNRNGAVGTSATGAVGATGTPTSGTVNGQVQTYPANTTPAASSSATAPVAPANTQSQPTGVQPQPGQTQPMTTTPSAAPRGNMQTSPATQPPPTSNPSQPPPANPPPGAATTPPPPK